ncbi:hypothetical protein MSIMFI_01639 [Mycobacterium simulans]|nr:hypothetical protein MSIMFI_01639 [Mycobacterium simulans]
MQLPCGGQGPPGRVGVFDRCAEDRQRRVALELIDEPAVPADGVHDHPEELVEQADDLGGRSRRGQLGGADQIDEQHRHVALLAAQLRASFDGPPGHVFADVATEQVTQSLPLGQVAHHVVEARLQQAQFAGIVDLHVSVVVAALHLAQRPAELAQWVGDRHGHQQGAGRPDAQRRQRQQQDGIEQRLRCCMYQRHLVGAHGQHDRQQWHGGGQHPRQHQPQDDAACLHVFRHTAAQRGDSDRPQDALRLQVADDCGGRGAQGRGDRHDGRSVTGHRPAGDDKHHAADGPRRHAGQRAVERHPQRAAAG